MLIGLVVTSAFSVPAAITVTQILAIDLIGELFPLAALGFDPPQKNIMQEKPRNLKQHVLRKSNFIDVLLTGVLMGALGYLNYLLFFQRNGISPSQDADVAVYAAATTTTYLTIILCQFGNILIRRTVPHSKLLSSYLWSNTKLLLAFGLSITCVLLLIYLPFLQPFFGTAALGAADWLCALTAAVLFVLCAMQHACGVCR